MKRFLVITALIMSWASVANAAVNDVANKHYQMSGAIKANIVARCGIVNITSSPMEFPEQFSIHFGETVVPVVLGDIIGTFQIRDDNLLSVGAVVDGEIAERKNNRLTLQYAGLPSIESAEKLKNLIWDKALEHGTDFGSDATITGYSFKSFVKVDSLKLVESIHVSIPNYPRTGCNAKLTVKRKLLGSIVVPVV